MAYATPTTYSTGDIPTAAAWNVIANNTVHAGSLKVNNVALSTYANGSEINVAITAKAYNSGTQSINDTTWTSVLFDTDEWDTSAIHNPSSNTDRFTVPIAGYYLVMGAVEWANNTTGFRSMRITLNGTQVSEQYRINLAAIKHNMNHSWVVKCTAASDIIRLQVYQNSGAGLNIGNASTYGISALVSFLGV